MILRYIAIVMIVSAIVRTFMLDHSVFLVLPIAMALSLAVIASTGQNKIQSETNILDDDNI